MPILALIFAIAAVLLLLWHIAITKGLSVRLLAFALIAFVVAFVLAYATTFHPVHF